MIYQLSKKYISYFGNPFIDSVDDGIYKSNYFYDCLKCNFCSDFCCWHGVDIDIENINRIKPYEKALERFLSIPKENWFLPDYNSDSDFPGGLYTRTSTIGNRCVFLDKVSSGCLIHKFCIDNNIDFHVLKPIVSCLFPITFSGGLLLPSTEIIDGSLVCMNMGINLYKGVRNDLRYYFGDDFIGELDELEVHVLSQSN